MGTDGPRNETRESKWTVDETKRERAKGRSTKRNESKMKTSERHSEAGVRRARKREDGMNLQKRSARQRASATSHIPGMQLCMHGSQKHPATSGSSCHAAPQAPPHYLPLRPAPAPVPRTSRCCRGPIVDHRQESSGWPFIGKFEWNRQM
jgi:hypothetical protein